MNEGLPDGIEQGDHAAHAEVARDVGRGCMNIIMIFVIIFGSGVFTGWALTVALGK
jgi:hypothetical protein